MQDVFQRISRLRDLSYRRYKKLSSTEKKYCISKKLKNDPSFLNILLKYKAITKCSIQEAHKWTEKHILEYKYYLTKRESIRPPFETKEKYVIKELQFQGFVPAALFKRKPDCYYVISKQPILGVTWILPHHGGHTDIQLKAGLPDVYKLHCQYGLANWTRVDIKYKL